MLPFEGWFLFWMVTDFLLIILYGVAKVRINYLRMKTLPAITLIIPVKNEAERIEAIIKGLAHYQYCGGGMMFNVLAIDYGSKDESMAILQRLAQRYSFLTVEQYNPDNYNFWQEERAYLFVSPALMRGQYLDFEEAGIVCVVNIRRMSVHGIIELLESLFRRYQDKRIA